MTTGTRVARVPFGVEEAAFALIDPFGFSGIPYALIQRLLSENKCEVLVTVMVDSINRWLAHPDENIKAHILETFGTDEAIKIAGGKRRPCHGTKKPLPPPA